MGRQGGPSGCRSHGGCLSGGAGGGSDLLRMPHMHTCAHGASCCHARSSPLLPTPLSHAHLHPHRQLLQHPFSPNVQAWGEQHILHSQHSSGGSAQQASAFLAVRLGRFDAGAQVL